MQENILLEKTVLDYITYFCKPDTFNRMKNTVLYMSESNIELLKLEINKFLNDTTIDDSFKRMEMEYYRPFVNFIRNNNRYIQQNVLQTEMLPFVEENNSYIVVVKSTMDINLAIESEERVILYPWQNDTIYVAMTEEAQILTISNPICDTIMNNGINVFALNIKNIDDVEV